MVDTTPSSSSCSSSTSPCASITSIDDIPVKSNTIKFLCSYGGRILPRYPDGKLRYVGGHTRVLSVDRSVTFSDLVAKMGELCGWSPVSLRCRMPTEDLHALVSITSDDELASLIEEYDLAAGHHKIRAFLHPSVPKDKIGSRYGAQIRGCVHRYSGSRYDYGNRNNYLYHHQQQQNQHQYHQYPVHHGNNSRY